MTKTYKIIRFYEQDSPEDVGISGLTLKEAQAHCKDPETSSKTCTSKEGKRKTKFVGNWFEGYTEE